MANDMARDPGEVTRSARCRLGFALAVHSRMQPNPTAFPVLRSRWRSGKQGLVPLKSFLVKIEN
jgi:hypothetical protein